MNVRNSLFFVALLLLAGCDNQDDKYLVLEYGDFGPQVLAWETLGGQWWQWDANAKSEPIHEHAIHVVVYHGVPAKQIKERFPVNKLKQQDFRYLDALESLRYLNRNIDALEKLDDEGSITVKQRLIETRAAITQKFDLSEKSQGAQNG